jgi:alpha-glucosidase
MGTFGYTTKVGVKTVTVYDDEPQKYELNEGLDAGWEHALASLKKL